MLPLQLALRPSRLLRLIHWTLLAWLAFIVWQRWGIVAAGISALLGAHAFRWPDTPRGLYIDTQGRFFLLSSPTRVLQAMHIEDGIVLSRFICCSCHSNGQHFCLLLLPDQTDPQSWRLLQNRIRWQRPPTEQGNPP